MTPISPFVTVAPLTNASYFAGSEAVAEAVSLGAAKTREPGASVKATIKQALRIRRMQTSSVATCLPTPVSQSHPRGYETVGRLMAVWGNSTGPKTPRGIGKYPAPAGNGKRQPHSLRP